MNQDPNSFYAAPQVDPVYQIQKESSWPKVIGIIGIVFGTFALLGGAFGLVATKFAQSQFSMAGLKEDFFERHYLLFKVVPIFGTALGFLLVVASILLIMRRRSSRTMILSWAVLKIVFAVWQTVISIDAQKEMLPMQMAQMQQGDKGALGPMGEQGVMDIVVYAAQIISVVWLSALPIFMLIWFLRGKIRNEVAGWQDPVAVA